MLALRMKLIFLITTKNNVSLYFIHSFVTCHFCIFTVVTPTTNWTQETWRITGHTKYGLLFFLQKMIQQFINLTRNFSIWMAKVDLHVVLQIRFYSMRFFTFYPNIMTNNQIEFLWCDEWIFEQIKHFDLSLYSLLNPSLWNIAA